MHIEAMHLSDYMAGNNPDQIVLSDEKVATEIKRSRATVSRIRRKKVRPDWETIEAIREFTKGWVTADDFRHVERSVAPEPSQDGAAA